MTRKTKKYIFLIILLIAAAGAAIGYYFYNKGPLNVKDSCAVKVTAADLYDTYDKDSATAQKKYTGKVVSVDGEIGEVLVNQQQKKILLLKINSDGASVNCTMETDIDSLHTGDKVNIKGICSGMGEADADLGIKGDVYLTRCYLISH